MKVTVTIAAQQSRGGGLSASHPRRAAVDIEFEADVPLDDAEPRQTLTALEGLTKVAADCGEQLQRAVDALAEKQLEAGSTS